MLAVASLHAATPTKIGVNAGFYATFTNVRYGQIMLRRVLPFVVISAVLGLVAACNSSNCGHNLITGVAPPRLVFLSPGATGVSRNVGKLLFSYYSTSNVCHRHDEVGCHSRRGKHGSSARAAPFFVAYAGGSGFMG
jgi:hypothetical protein